MRINSRHSSDTFCSVGLLVGAVLLWFWLIPTYTHAGDDRTLPRLLTLAIGGLALALLFVSLSGQRTNQIAADEEDPFLERDTHGDPWRLFLLIAVWGADVFLMRTFGFYIVSFLAISSSFIILGMRVWWRIAVWSIAPLIVVHLLFERGFLLLLPRGEIVRAVLG